MRDFVAARIESSAFDPDLVHIAELTGTEHISRLFEFRLRLALLEGSLDEDALLTSPATLVFERRSADGSAPVELRRISGMIRAICDRALSESKHREYLVTFVPRAWRATLSKTSDVCMDLGVPDIIKKKLGEVGLDPGQDLVFRLRQDHAPREFVVQYHESHWDFACRLAEDLGIHFFFEESDGRDVLVFGDENTAFTPSQPASSAFRQRGDRIDVYELEARRELVSKSFVARDYNYRNPSMEVLGEAQTSALGEGKVDEYGPHAKTPAEATYYARVRAEEAASRSFTYEGKSDLPGLRAGSQLTVEGHPRGDVEMIVTEVIHELIQPVLGVTSGDERPYRNTFRGLPKAVAYRPARLTPKPRVHGVVTGIVEAASPTKMGAIDDQGRYRVAFMYDSVTGRGDGKASRPLRMAQPSAGATRGFHAPLVPGTEVLITCVNGDPDRPIIAGAVSNPQTPSPVTAANAEKSMWVTNVSSIAIDDDKPRCKVSVNGGEHVLQLGEPNGPEVGALISSVKNVSTMAKKVKTSSSEMKNAFTAKKTGVASKDILEAAGVPNPISTWEKIEAIVEKTAEFAKAVIDMADSVNELFDDVRRDTEEHKKEADEKLAAAKKKAFEKLGKGKGKPKPIEDPNGGARYETQDEADARAYAEALQDPANKATADAIAAATKDAADAQKELDEYEEKIGTKEAKEALDEGVEAFKKAGEYVEKKAELAEKVLEMKGIGPYLESLGADKLISKVSEIFAKATQQALDVTVSATQKAAHAIPKVSGQRTGDDVGSFASPFNIQLSRHSAALYGWKNSFVYGGKNATVFSAGSTSILARKRVDVKSTSQVEIASKKVAVSAKKEIDAYSDGTMLLVAASKGVKMPSNASVVVHGQKDAHFVSDDESVHVKANKNISAFAQTGNMVLTVKKGDLLASAQAGKVEIMADDGQAALRAKKKAVVQSLDEDFTVVADKGKGTVKASKELHLESKSGQWKTSGDVEFKVKKFTVNGSKVELG